MKRLKYLVLVLVFSVFILISCAANKRDTPRTIELTVDSNIVPEFSANYGEGTYDEVSKVYTHRVDYVKDLYIYLSKSEYKTEKVEIKASEMVDDVIKKTVTFGNKVPCSVRITFGEVDDISDVTYDNSVIKEANISGNIMTFEYPDKNDSKELVFKKNGYQDIKVSLTKENMSSGVIDIKYPFIKNDEVAITFTGGMQYSNYSYLISEYDTNKVIAQGYYSTNGKNYILLSSDKKYYALLQNSDLFVIEKGESKIIDVSKYNSRYDSDSFGLNISGFSVLLVDKRTNKIVENYYSGLDSLDNYFFVTMNQDKVYMAYDITGLVTKYNDKGYGNNYYTYTVNLSDFTEVDANLTVKNKITGETVTEYDVYNLSYENIKYENNKLVCEALYLKSANCRVNLVDANKNILATITNEIYVSSDIDDSYKSGSIDVDGKPIAYAFPLFVKNLSYDKTNNYYTYPDQMVDTSKQYIKIYDDNLQSVYFEISDEKGKTVNRTNDGYYEVKVNTKYYYSNPNKYIEGKEELFVTKEDIEKGFIILSDNNYNTKDIIVPEGMRIRLDNSGNVLYKVDSTHYKLLISPYSSSFVGIRVYNKYVDVSCNYNLNSSDSITVNKLWTKPYDGYNFNNSCAVRYSDDNNIEYYSFVDTPQVNISGEILVDAIGVWNEELDAYVCDIAKSTNCKVIKSYSSVENFKYNNFNYYYVDDSATSVTINGNIYSLSEDVDYYIFENDNLEASNMYFNN